MTDNNIDRLSVARYCTIYSHYINKSFQCVGYTVTRRVSVIPVLFFFPHENDYLIFLLYNLYLLCRIFCLLLKKSNYGFGPSLWRGTGTTIKSLSYLTPN
jgi:hypothetical protein